MNEENESMCGSRPVMSGVPQGSVLRLLLFNVFISDVGSGIKCTLSKFADDTKLNGTVDANGGRDAIWKDPDRLEKWVCMNLMGFYKTKGNILHLCWSNPRYEGRTP